MTEFGSEESYNRCYDDFMNIPEGSVIHNTMPPDVATAEARELAVAAMEDKEVLVSMGLSPQLVDSLMDRAGAFTYAMAKHHTALAGDPESLTRWKEAYPGGYELQKYLTRFMTFAYRRDTALSARMDDIRKGRGHRDMIQDLLDLAVLAEDHPEPLQQMPAFDFSKVAEAKELHNTLGILLAKSSVDPKVVHATKEIMNRAFTWYKMAADEVKTTGQFAFEGTDRYANYVSEYRQNIRKKNARLTPVEEADESEAV